MMSTEQETTIQEFESESNERYSEYPEYENSTGENLQKVPSHWESRSFQYWADNKSNKGDEQKRDFITLEHINSVTGDLVEDFEWVKRKSGEYYTFKSGDVLFGKLRPYLRKYYLVDRDGCCGTDFMVLRPKSDVKNKFLYYFLQSEDFIQYADANSHGVKMPRTSWRKISSAYYRLPPYEEQEAIVEFLDREIGLISQLIDQKKNLVGLLKEKRFSIINNAVTHGIGHSESKSGSERLENVPDGWDIIKLKYLAENLDSERIPLNGDERDKMQGDIPYWGANSVMDYVNDWIFNEKLVLLGEDGAPFFDRTREVSFVIEGKNWVNNHAHILRTNEKISDYFLKHVLNTVDYARYLKGSTRDKLTKGEMSQILVQVPPKEEQEEIVSYIDQETKKVNDLIEKAEEGIKRLKEYRQSLITEVVTGQIDVRGEV